MSPSEPLVSVILPAHDEAATIAEVVHRCFGHTRAPREVWVIDDGSRDHTAELAMEAGAEVVRLWPNRGKGAAIREALGQIRGEIVVLLDADGQDEPADIPRLLAALEPDVDLVIGSRFLGTFERGAISGINKVGTMAINGLFNLAFGAQVTDTQAGFRALRTTTLRQLALSARRYDVETEMLCQVVARGGRVVEVPVTRRGREHGTTDFSRIRDGFRIVGRIAQTRLGL
jgi:glycosyltransferase involved in cell wall biosynthesis